MKTHFGANWFSDGRMSCGCALLAHSSDDYSIQVRLVTRATNVKRALVVAYRDSCCSKIFRSIVMAHLWAIWTRKSIWHVTSLRAGCWLTELSEYHLSEWEVYRADVDWLHLGSPEKLAWVGFLNCSSAVELFCFSKLSIWCAPLVPPILFLVSASPLRLLCFTASSLPCF